MERQRKALRVLKWTFILLSTTYILLAVFSRTTTKREEIHGRRSSRELVQRGREQMTWLKLMHRNAHDSPFRKPWGTRLESIRSLIRGDKSRFATLAENNVAPSWSDSPAEAPASGSVRRTIGAPIFSGASVGVGEYFVDLEIGTPPKRVLLIADTGSDLLWVKCRYRTGPRQQQHNSDARVFDADVSSTFSPVPCTAEECQLVPPPPRDSCSVRHPTGCKYMYTYADQSDSTGVIAYETVTINATGGVRIPGVVLGCSTVTHGNGFDGADGVIGLGQGSISFPSQLGYSYGDKFSYCLVDHLKGNGAPSTDSNYIVFGDWNLHHPRPHLQYTPILKNPPTAPEALYYLSVRGVKINGECLPIPQSAWEVDATGNGGTIIDSGTTLSYILEPAYRVVLETVENLVSYPRIELDPFDLCFNSSGIKDLCLPDFSIDFEGGAFFRPAVDNYFFDAAEGVKCLGILGSSSPFGFNVIGNIMQQNFLLEFDRRNSRLGFAPTDCSRH